MPTEPATAHQAHRTYRTGVFVDAHVHLAQTGFMLAGLNLSGATGAQDVLDRLAGYAAGTDGPVVLGGGWDETGWSDPRLPTLTELDRVAPGRVVYLGRVDGHSALVSSALVDRTPELVGTDGWDGSGRIERSAIAVAREGTGGLIPRSQRKAAIAGALAAAAAAGIGRVHEMSAPHINPPEDIALIRELLAERPSIDVVPYWGEHASSGGVEHAIELGCAGAAGDLNIDGALGSRTAALVEPYADGDGQHHGHRYLDADAVAEHVVACTRAGISAGFHCIGDAATSAAAEGFARAARALGAAALAARRHRLEHVELIDTADPAILATLAECGVVLSVQPAFDAFWGGASGMYAERLGAERAMASNPLAAFADAGLVMEFGSDSPVTPFDPWGGVRAAAFHHNTASRLTGAQAHARHVLPAGEDTYTEWAVPGGYGPDGLPGLAPGLPAPTCLRTVVGGRTVFTADEGQDCQ